MGGLVAKKGGSRLKNASSGEPRRQGNGFSPARNHTPEAGDVVVIQNFPRDDSGHMAMYTGKQWVSDYWQTIDRDRPDGFWPSRGYLAAKPSYVIYRYTKKR
jgi:hypothetical protein